MSRLALRTPMAILPLDDAETIMYPMLGTPVIPGARRVFSYNNKLFSTDSEGDLCLIAPTLPSHQNLPDGIDGLLAADGRIFVYDYVTAVTGSLNCLDRIMAAANELAGINGLRVMTPRLIKDATDLDTYCNLLRDMPQAYTAVYLKSIDAPYIQNVYDQKQNGAWYIYWIPEYGTGTICEIVEGAIIVKDDTGNDVVLRKGVSPLQYFIDKYKDELIGQEAKYVKKNGTYRLLEIPALDKLENNHGTV
jgi:hypothetical protein